MQTNIINRINQVLYIFLSSDIVKHTIMLYIKFSYDFKLINTIPQSYIDLMIDEDEIIYVQNKEIRAYNKIVGSITTEHIDFNSGPHSNSLLLNDKIYFYDLDHFIIINKKTKEIEKIKCNIPRRGFSEPVPGPENVLTTYRIASNSNEIFIKESSCNQIQIFNIDNKTFTKYHIDDIPGNGILMAVSDKYIYILSHWEILIYDKMSRIFKNKVKTSSNIYIIALMYDKIYVMHWDETISIFDEITHEYICDVPTLVSDEQIGMSTYENELIISSRERVYLYRVECVF